jgi:lipid-A-disaccharide synthase
VNPFTAWVARRVVRLPTLTMVNLIAGEPVVPELIQEDARPERLAAAVGELLGPAGDAQRLRLAEVRERLGGGGAARRVAEIAREMIAGDRTVDPKIPSAGAPARAGAAAPEAERLAGPARS